MRLDIVNANIVNGDGETFIENASLVIRDELIENISRVKHLPYNAYADRVIDVKGNLVIPGLINIHAHGVGLGPFFPYAWNRLSEERVLHNLDTHLFQGTTTILNCDGMSIPYETEIVNKMHAVNIKFCTLHTQKNLRAAEVSGGEGLKERHKEFSAEEAVSLGAIALGEVGSPATSYGTAEKRNKTGIEISAGHAKALDDAVLSGNEDEIQKALKTAGLEKMTIDMAKKLVNETTIFPIEASCEAIAESVSTVKKLNVPVLIHTDKDTKDEVLNAAKALGPKLIAVHVNHTFSTEEAICVAKQLKSYGSFVEIITADIFGAKQVESDEKTTFALIKENLVDVISTDFSGGYHDPILFVLQKAIEEGIVSLPRAVACATNTPAKIIARLAPNRGKIEPGKIADLCIVDREDISKVKYVIIAGKIIVQDGIYVKH